MQQAKNHYHTTSDLLLGFYLNRVGFTVVEILPPVYESSSGLTAAVTRAFRS